MFVLIDRHHLAIRDVKDDDVEDEIPVVKHFAIRKDEEKSSFYIARRSLFPQVCDLISHYQGTIWCMIII